MLVVLLFVLTSVVPVHSANKKVIKVGYPIQRGLTEKDEEGNYIGYTVDYLNEIKKYTGWDYKFVEVEGSINEQLTTLLEMLARGEIDLMGGMVYNDSLAQIYDYPGYNYGMAYTTIAVRIDDAKWIPDDFQNWNGIKIGIYPGLERRAKELEKFANVNGFTYELVKFNTYDELMEKVRSGEVDATLLADIAMPNDLKSIAKFSPVPYYFAVSKGNSELVRELNTALSNIDSGNPNLQATLYEKYFTVNNEFFISEENKQYIKSLGTIKVLMIDGNAPIQFYDKEAKGVSISYLEMLKKATGLQYEVIVAENYDDCMEKIKKGDIDLMVGIPSNSDLISKLNLTLSLPYLDSYSVLISNKRSVQEYSAEKDFIYNTEATLDQMEKGNKQIAYLDSYCANFYLQKTDKYKNITLNVNDTNEIQYSIGLVDKEKMYLLSIINSFMSTVSLEEKQEIIYENTIVHVNYTLSDIFRLYRWQILVIILFILFLGILIYARNMRMKSAMLNEIVIQHKRFNELSNLTDECLFEYSYTEDILRIQNNKIMFEKKHIIENYMSYNKYEFLRNMISAKEDGSYEFVLNDEGMDKWYRVILKVIKNKDNVASYALGKIYNVDEEVVERYKLLERSKRDTLTKLLNRAGAEEYINHLLELNASKGVLILFDIDNFKAVNDNLGHPVGDQLLKEISQFIEGYFRKEDIKCRLGGDEFLVFLHTNIFFDNLNEKLNDFMIQANECVFKAYSELKVGLSIGATYVSEKVCTYEELYKKADHAMYVAKLGGKNRFFIADM